MRHTLPLPERCLAAVLFTAIGLGTYGCGDTGSVSEPAELGSLSASPGTLLPPFNPATTSYTVKIPSSLSSTTITASPRVTGDTIRIDNQPTTSQTVTLTSPEDKKTVTIVVTDSGAGGTSRSYRVEVEKDVEDTTLRTLSVLPGTLSPSTFDISTPNYTVNDIDSAVTEVTISATKSDPNTVMQIGSVTVPEGTASGQSTVRLRGSGSATESSIVVTAPGGSTSTYTVTINRGASTNNFLRSLSVSSGSTTLSLIPRFTSGSLDYTVNVASNIGSVSVTARLDDNTARMTVNGETTNSGQARIITLNPAGPNPSPTTIPIIVTAQNGSQKRYSVNVIRAALGGNNNLSALTISSGSLAFRADTLTYTVNVGSNVPSVDVSATKADRNATMSQDVTASPGTATGRATIQLGGPGSTTPVLIAVTAPNGSSKTYRINVVKDALGGNNNLSALRVSIGSADQTLTPAFGQSPQNAYTLNVASSVTEVIVSATKADPSAVISGDVPNSGQANITLTGAGTTTRVSINVAAPNGDVKPYTIDIIRAAPAAPPVPTIAPDLIDADDPFICIAPDPFDPNDPNACDPTKSDATTKDNVTSVTTPRFSIPSPGAGVTPKLWVNGVKDVNSTFTQGVLRRSTSFSEGTYTITYNLMNDVGGGESGESPPLDPPLRIIIGPPPPPTP